MKLSEAVQIVNQGERLPGSPIQVMLACGFTPLHLGTFLCAHLQKALQGRPVKVTSGLYGDLVGTLERQPEKDIQMAAVALEWADLDARLGYRSLGGWGPGEEAELPVLVKGALSRIRKAIEKLSGTLRVAVSLPTLPLSPAFHASGWESGRAELEIGAALADFASALTEFSGVSVVSQQYLHEQSSFGHRLNVELEVLFGHPYSTAHADAVGQALAQVLQPAAPKKGLITDLDDTLWCGLVGEIEPEAVAWDLSNKAHLHGLYQQTLVALAQQGVLLAAASKNNPEAVEPVFARPDIRLGKDKIFPIQVNWGPKSESVRRILAAWNIGADSVVFVDDSPMEIAEVASAWPEINCLLFPKDNYAAGLALCRKLRDLFGKSQLADEDMLRLASIRAAATLAPEGAPGSQPETFLAQCKPVLRGNFRTLLNDPRVLELVNKTNQFNMNGIRFTEPEWRKVTGTQNSFVLAVSYEDKYGPLGKIAVIAGSRGEDELSVGTWVMSCRAFSRRIEHGCLSLLFSNFHVDRVRLDFAATPKNGPFREAFAPFLGAAPVGAFTLTRAQFHEKCPSLYFKVETVL